MGLDGVEIVLATEERFGIGISNAEAERCRTPGDLINLVCRQLGVQTSPCACRTRQAFYRLRQRWTLAGRAERNQIKPSTRLETWMARGSPSETWKRMQTEVRSTAWPKLDLASTVHATIASWALLAGASFFFTTQITGKLGPTPNLLMAIGITVLTLVGAYRWIPWPRTALPGSIRTAGDLAAFLVLHDPAWLAGPSGWDRERVALAVREIVVDHLACDDTYREDADFVRDLGLS
jgi:hypothetical protein